MGRKPGRKPASERSDDMICGAKTQSGAPCKGYPVAGPGTRCWRHNGKQQRDGNPGARVHGKQSPVYHRIAPEAQQRIDDALKDPDLLDVRRPVAVGQVLMQEAPLIPTDEQLRAAVRMHKLRGLAAIEFKDISGLDEWLEPSTAEIDAMRQRHIDKSMQIIERFARRQADAAKQIEAARLLNEAAVPILSEMGTRIRKLILRYVEESKQEEFTGAVRMEIRMAVHQLAQTSR